MSAQHMGVKIRFKRGAWWLVIDHKGRRRSKKIGDRDTANITAKKVREALVAGDLGCTVRETAQVLVEGYANEWLNGLKGNLKASTVSFYSDNLRRHILPALGTLARGESHASRLPEVHSRDSRQGAEAEYCERHRPHAQRTAVAGRRR